MNIVIFGATGMIGRRIVQEALSRGHTVTGVVRDPSRSDLSGEGLTLAQGDLRDGASVARLAAGHDAAVSAFGPAQDQPVEIVADVARTLLDALPKAGVRRLIFVSGAGSLEVAPGVQLLDVPEFPAEWRGIAAAHRDALELFRSSDSDLDWTVFSPAAYISPGERTGRYRTGTDQLVADAQGHSAISAEDYAVALLDELEQPKFIRRRFTAAY
jgi:putative NADH-flavin reductase